MTTPVLHDFPLDPRCYSVRLALSLMGVEHLTVPVDVFPGAAHLEGRYRDLTPTGLLPVLETHTDAFVGAEAALTHLVKGTAWSPPDDRWLTFAAGPLELVYACRETSLYTIDPIDNAAARSVLQEIDDHLAVSRPWGDWLSGEKPTASDLAVYPAAALSRDIGIDHDAYPALRRWMRLVKQLPGFVDMPGIPVFP